MKKQLFAISGLLFTTTFASAAGYLCTNGSKEFKLTTNGKVLIFTAKVDGLDQVTYRGSFVPDGRIICGDGFTGYSAVMAQYVRAETTPVMGSASKSSLILNNALFTTGVGVAILNGSEEVYSCAAIDNK